MTNLPIGDQILDLISRDNLVRAEHINGNTLFIWQGNAAEQLEALVESTYDKKPTPCDIDQIAQNIMSVIDSKDMLAKMTGRELIDCVLDCDAADYNCVIELMNRVLPGWEQE